MWQAKSRLLPPRAQSCLAPASEQRRIPLPKALPTQHSVVIEPVSAESSLRKREFLLFGLETFGKFSRRLPFSRHQRLWTIAQKPVKFGTFGQ
jgi:hypothetical protein